jgi:aromatic-L-amino-acid decarboxylase
MASSREHPLGGSFVQSASAVARHVETYWQDLEQEIPPWPVLSTATPGQVLSKLPGDAPMHPETLERVLDDVREVILPGLTHWQAPGFFGYFPANTSPPAVLADLLCAGLGVQGMSWATSPACTELEVRVLDWLARAIGLPSRFEFGDGSGPGGAVIQGTASEAAITTLVAARSRMRRRLGPSARVGVYASTQAHSSIAKAALIAGVIDRVPDFAGAGDDGGPVMNAESAGGMLRLVARGPGLAMDTRALERAMSRDAALGITPTFIVATVGTTASMAVDDVGACATLAARHGAWLHVDAAFAGAACVCPEFRDLLRGCERADSFCFNPHKWLLTTFDCDCLYLADRRAVSDALSVTPEYLRNPADAGAAHPAQIDYRDWQLPLGRRMRALKLWFVMRLYGIEGLRAYIREHVRLGEIFAGLVAGDERLELVVPRGLSLVCFAPRARPGESLASVNDRARALLLATNADGRVYLTHATLPTDGEGSAREPGHRFVLRMAIGGSFTQERHVRLAWSIIREALR